MFYILRIFRLQIYMAKEWKTIRLASLWRSDITTTWKGNVSNHLSPRWRYWYVLLRLFYSHTNMITYFLNMAHLIVRKRRVFVALCSKFLIYCTKIHCLTFTELLNWKMFILILIRFHIVILIFCILIWYLDKKYNFLLSNTTIWLRTIR